MSELSCCIVCAWTILSEIIKSEFMIRRIIILPTFTFWSFMLALVCVSTIAQGEALDGTAEHLIEVPMDFRYLSLPSADERHSVPGLCN